MKLISMPWEVIVLIKTEPDPALVKQCKRVVEYSKQTRLEGEIHNLPGIPLHAELWELVSGITYGRENDHEITLFNAVGFTLDDFLHYALSIDWLKT